MELHLPLSALPPSHPRLLPSSPPSAHTHDIYMQATTPSLDANDQTDKMSNLGSTTRKMAKEGPLKLAPLDTTSTTPIRESDQTVEVPTPSTLLMAVLVQP